MLAIGFEPTSGLSPVGQFGNAIPLLVDPRLVAEAAIGSTSTSARDHRSLFSARLYLFGYASVVYMLSTSLILGKIFKHPTRVASYYFVFVLQPTHKFFPQLWRIELAGKPAVVAELAPVAAIHHSESYARQTLSLSMIEVKLPEQAN